MDNKEELQEFDLDDIMKEFGSAPEAEPAEEPEAALPEQPAEAPLETAVPEAVPEAPAEDAADEASAPEAPVEEAPAIEGDTMRFDPVIPEISDEEADSEAAGEAEEAVPDDDTKAIDDLISEALAAEDAEDGGEESAPEFKEEDFVPPAPIVFTPRSRLRELKKKLVAGPEKRYYELSEMGVGRLQVAILVNVIIVLLCAGATTLFALDMVPANRLRLVIFSQVLAMLVSALLGCHQMLDGLAEILKARFTINTLLVFTFAACCADAIFCLKELRVPCCAAFSLEITMALIARYQRRTAEMGQMDTMRKAVRLHSMVKVDNYYEGKPGLLRSEGEVEDFMDTYNVPSAPEKVQSVYAFLSLLICIGIAVFAGMRHGVSLAIQILSTSLLVAVPASFFIATTRPMAVLEKRLHMVGTVLCGWKGVKGLSGKAAFPLNDQDLFPQGSTKLNGVKFYGDRNPDEVVSYTTSLISAAGGGLVPVFQQLLQSRNCSEHPVSNFQNYGSGGIGGEVCDEPVLLGSLDFLRDMGVDIPDGTMVSQAVYAAIDGQLCAVYAISYAKMRSAAAGMVTLCGTRKLTPVMTCGDFMLTESFLRAKFEVKTRRIAFPTRDVREELLTRQPDPEAPALALITREDLVSAAYAVTGARALRTSTKLGVAIHLIGGILGILIMLVLAYLGSTELLTPTNVLLYQLVWLIPGWLVTEWTRAV